MSNIQQVPAHIAARIAERNKTGERSDVADAFAGNSSTPSIPRISMRGSKFRLVQGAVETEVGSNLEVTIVGSNPRTSKVYYASAYNPKAEDKRPTCFSNDGLKPDESVLDPVCNSCANCPNNVLGSKILPSGAKSKLCADQRHLAVVPAQDPSKVYSLTVPVSGMKALREYIIQLTNYNIPPEYCITELGFDAEASYPKITFKNNGYLSEKGIGAVDQLKTLDEVKVATRMLAPKAADLALEAPAAANRIAARTIEDDEAAAYEEPVVAKAREEKPKVAPVKASDELASKLDSLFDE